MGVADRKVVRYHVTIDLDIDQDKELGLLEPALHDMFKYRVFRDHTNIWNVRVKVEAQ